MRESAYKKAITKLPAQKDTTLYQIAFHLELFTNIQKDAQSKVPTLISIN